MEQLQRILIIDDNADTAYLHKRLLEDMGIAREVIYITDASEALQHISDQYSIYAEVPVVGKHLIFLDLNMPSMNGYQFLEILAPLSINTDSLSIVMLTSSIDPGDRLKTEHVGDRLDGYLLKPLSKPVIDSLLPKILKFNKANSL